MRWLGKLVIWIFALVALGVGALWVFGPREPVDLTMRFDDSVLAGGVDGYLTEQEAQFDDVTPGTEKRVVWASAPETKTPLSIVYLHGFSASSEEIRPVPDNLARALGANLVFTRFAGHGRGSDAMAEPTVNDWMQDVAEALAVARAVGDRVVVLSVSTGGALITLAATDPTVMQDVAGLAYVSPNFRIKAPITAILTWPAVRHWGPLIAGHTRTFPPRNDAQAQFWTTTYPTVATLPMAAAAKAAREMDHSAISIPALFVYDPADQVVEPQETRRIANLWGGPAEVQEVRVRPGDDSYAHVIAGDILSPGMTDEMSERLTRWVEALPE